MNCMCSSWCLGQVYQVGVKANSSPYGAVSYVGLSFYLRKWLWIIFIVSLVFPFQHVEELMSIKNKDLLSCKFPNDIRIKCEDYFTFQSTVFYFTMDLLNAQCFVECSTNSVFCLELSAKVGLAWLLQACQGCRFTQSTLFALPFGIILRELIDGFRFVNCSRTKVVLTLPLVVFNSEIIACWIYL